MLMGHAGKTGDERGDPTELLPAIEDRLIRERPVRRFLARTSLTFQLDRSTPLG